MSCKKSPQDLQGFAENCLPITIRRCREAKGWSQEALATFAGVHHSTIVNYELGRAKPDFENLLGLMQALGEDFARPLLEFVGLSLVICPKDKPTPKEARSAMETLFKFHLQPDDPRIVQ